MDWEKLAKSCFFTDVFPNLLSESLRNKGAKKIIIKLSWGSCVKHRKIVKLPWGQQGQQGQQMSVGSVASVVGSVVSRPVAESVGQ